MAVPLDLRHPHEVPAGHPARLLEGCHPCTDIRRGRRPTSRRLTSVSSMAVPVVVPSTVGAGAGGAVVVQGDDEHSWAASSTRVSR